ncbi:hemin uptake protein HemP [Sagittula marina]|uniref:Hemin uptake protein HemP n=2 Tax=Roseobacteraceae TaxID=2854170 RepID=A0A7W6DQN3_9RHOB|nr:hemin uptake protein HemP [Sagittula marina]
MTDEREKKPMSFQIDSSSLAYADATPRYDAQALIPEGTKAEIDLNGQVYTLRITRAGKLILTK